MIKLTSCKFWVVILTSSSQSLISWKKNEMRNKNWTKLKEKVDTTKLGYCVLLNKQHPMMIHCIICQTQTVCVYVYMRHFVHNLVSNSNENGIEWRARHRTVILLCRTVHVYTHSIAQCILGNVMLLVHEKPMFLPHSLYLSLFYLPLKCRNLIQFEIWAHKIQKISVSIFCRYIENQHMKLLFVPI